MACNVTKSQKFYDGIDKEIEFLINHGRSEQTISRIIKDIDATIDFIEKSLTATNLASSIRDYNYSDRRFFITNKYGYKIYVKPYPEQNIIKAVCLVGKHQQFKQEMFIEQLRQTYKELGGDYDEATRQYLAEQARRSSMSDVDIIIEDICRR